MIKIAKAVYRRLFPVFLREKFSYGLEWTKLVVNYQLMRSSILNRFHLFGAWPHSLYIEGTNICNARCAFCAYPQMERPKVTMTMEVFRKAIDEYLALGPGEVDLTPIVGDPFVDKFLFERLDDSRPGPCPLPFYTNAILMKPESRAPWATARASGSSARSAASIARSTSGSWESINSTRRCPPSAA